MKCLFVALCIWALLSTPIYAQRLDDSSDWWSINREDPRTPTTKPSNHELPAGNFSLAGVTLGQGGVEAVTARLGQAPEVERGDASTGRSQLCYTAAANSSVHVIFEFAEDESIFYLFSRGPAWTGSKYCVPSQYILDKVSTASGLRLGLTRAEVEAILGPPDAAIATELLYFRYFQKRASPEEFNTLRKDYPTPLNDDEAHKKFDFYPVEQRIVVRLLDSRLAYLAVSISGSGD